MNKLVQVKVLGVQIMPFIEDPAYYDSSEYIKRQPEGPNEYTSGFFVQLRLEHSGCKLVATTPTQEDADFVAQAYATHHGVQVDFQSWKQKE